MPSVFISYSHDPMDPTHAERVAGLAASLLRDGLKVFFDQNRGDEEEGLQWPIWMDDKIQEADYVLLVCTELYWKKVRQKVAEDEGRGVCWEANIIYALLYEKKLNTTKFLPVLFSPADRRFIPIPLGGRDYFVLNLQSGYEHLYAFLTRQHRARFPDQSVALRTIAQKTIKPLFAPPGRDATPAQTDVAPIPDRPLPAPEPFPSKPDESRNPEGQTTARLVTLDTIPAVGKLIGRREYIKKIKAFLADKTRKLAIMQGFPGIGKTVLVARLAEMFESPKAVLWARCVADQALEDVLFSRLNAFFEAQGDTSLRTVWSDPDPAHFDIKINYLIHALATRKYLLIFDEFENWLTHDLEWKNDQLRRTFASVLRSTHCSKIVLISSQRALFDPLRDRLPLGITLEQTICGLTETESIRLLRATGLRKDEGLLRKIAGHCEGNPYLLQVVSHQLLHLHRDPEELFKSGTQFADLLNIATRDLSPEARFELDRISVFRRLLSYEDLRKLGTDLGVVAALVGHFLITENRTSDAVGIANVVRNWVLAVMPEARLREFHQRAADFYATQNTSTPTTYEDTQPWLEEIYHRFEGVDFEGAARAISKIALLLIDWGYVDYAEQNISRLLNATNELSVKAQSSFWLGIIQDLRANFDGAHKYFEQALDLFGQANDYAGMAKCNFRIGRTHNAAHRLAEAKDYFKRCIGICEAHGVTDGWAASLLGMGWSLQEQSVGDILTGDILDLYRDGLNRAKATGDFETLSSAHRHIGFLLWTKKQQQPAAAEHLEQARKISEQHKLMNEMGAVCAELGYLYREWGDSEKAEQNCDRAIEIWSRLGNRHGLGSALCNLGAIRDLQGNLEQAVEFYTKSRDTYSEIHDAGGQAYPALCLGRALVKMGKLPEARDNFSEALRLATENGLQETAANARNELAKVSASE